jgi:hypothetical protein
MPLENIVKSLATNTQTFQQETGASIQNLKNQISLLASSVYKIESNKGRLPSQAKINPKKNISAMILRSGKEVQIKTITTGTQQRKEKLVESLDLPTNKVSKNFALPSSNILIHPPFPGRIAKQKKNVIENEIFETF